MMMIVMMIVMMYDDDDSDDNNDDDVIYSHLSLIISFTIILNTITTSAIHITHSSITRRMSYDCLYTFFIITTIFRILSSGF